MEIDPSIILADYASFLITYRKTAISGPEENGTPDMEKVIITKVKEKGVG